MLKADLHIHTKGDPIDTFITYTPKDLIRKAAKLKYDLLSFTWHDKVCDIKPLRKFAKQRGITLLQGVELTIEGKHTLLYNVTQREADKIQTFADLEKVKDHVLVGAPHPFFLLPTCLGKKLETHRKLFDFVEHSHFYSSMLNRNTPAVAFAKKYKMPLVATSDVHYIEYYGKDFSMIDTTRSRDAVIDTLKRAKFGRKVSIQTRPYGTSDFISATSKFIPRGLAFFGLGKHIRKKH